jgi:hypothetical protein
VGLIINSLVKENSVIFLEFGCELSKIWLRIVLIKNRTRVLRTIRLKKTH